MRKTNENNSIKDLPKWQRAIIHKFEKDLSPEQIHIIATKGLSSNTIETILSLYKKNYDVQLIQNVLTLGQDTSTCLYLLKALEKGYSIGELEEIVKAYPNHYQISAVLGLMNEGLSFKTIKEQIPNNTYGNNIMNIGKGILEGLSCEQINPMFNKEWNHYKLMFYRKCMSRGMTIDDITHYLNSNFTTSTWFEIYVGLEKGLTLEQIDLYSQQEFDSYQMMHIRDGLQASLPITMVQKYAKPEFDNKTMRFLKEQMIKRDLTENQIDYIISLVKHYSIPQLTEIAEGFRTGLSDELVQSYTNKTYSEVKMMKIRYKLANKKKDQYYRNVIDRAQKNFISTPLGHVIQISLVLAITLSYVLFGVYVANNPDVIFSDMYKIITTLTGKTLRTVLTFLLIVEVLKSLFISLSPHADTALRHILNAITTSAATYMIMGYVNNLPIQHGLQFLILSISINIFLYLNKIKYYS